MSSTPNLLVNQNTLLRGFVAGQLQRYTSYLKVNDEKDI